MLPAFKKLATLVLVATLTACAAPAAPTAVPTSAPALTTNTPPPATTAPTEAPAVTPTQAPAASPTPARITFAAGATTAEVQGQLQANEIKDFVLQAQQDQPMIVALDSPNQDVHLTIYGQTDGLPLVRAASDATTWQGLLPATQDYIIKAVGPATATNFHLGVEIPQRLTFAPGATATVVTGTAQAGVVVAYVLRTNAGQTLTATLTSPQASVKLTIYGFEDGLPLVRSASDATTWTGALPGTQNYIIKAVQTGEPVDFTLTITVQ